VPLEDPMEENPPKTQTTSEDTFQKVADIATKS
jgi:hypothetical protein